ncbi:hypothetical protein HHI36_007762 [Cryptolaemus montrouzieri]|uniref:Uncharacterized protein n=1 Tax=Cryptolaemus montrouzieri TaxID=559131 RepID=A0ABD2MQE6_9CUCU
MLSGINNSAEFMVKKSIKVICELNGKPAENQGTCVGVPNENTFSSPIVLENRIGRKRPSKLTKRSKLLSKTTEPDEPLDEEDDMNGLFNNFWAVDNLPKQPMYVAVQKMPDVYIGDDQPPPICDAVAVERSEITEETRDIRPEFGKIPFYDPSIKVPEHDGNINGNYNGFSSGAMCPQYSPQNALPYGYMNPYDYRQNTQNIVKEINESCDDVSTSKITVENSTEVCTSTQSVTTVTEINKETTTGANLTTVLLTTNTEKKEESTSTTEKNKEQSSVTPSLNIEKIPKRKPN